MSTNHPIWTKNDADAPKWTRAEEIKTNGHTRWATPTKFPTAAVPPIGGTRPIHVDDLRFAWLVGR